MHIKHLDWTTIQKHMTKLNCEFASGRATEAPQLHQLSQSMLECELMGFSQQWPLLAGMLDAMEHDHKGRRARVAGGELGIASMGCKASDGRKQWKHNNSPRRRQYECEEWTPRKWIVGFPIPTYSNARNQIGATEK